LLSRALMAGTFKLLRLSEFENKKTAITGRMNANVGTMFVVWIMTYGVIAMCVHDVWHAV